MSGVHLCAWKQSSACSLCKEPHDWGSWRVYQVTHTYTTSHVWDQSQRSRLDPFHAWVLGNKIMPGAQNKREEVGLLGDAGGSWNSRTGWPATHNKRPNQIQVSGSCKGWQKAFPWLKPALLMVPWGLQQKFQKNKEISGKETHISFFFIIYLL